MYECGQEVNCCAGDHPSHLFSFSVHHKYEFARLYVEGFHVLPETKTLQLDQTLLLLCLVLLFKLGTTGSTFWNQEIRQGVIKLT